MDSSALSALAVSNSTGSYIQTELAELVGIGRSTSTGLPTGCGLDQSNRRALRAHGGAGARRRLKISALLNDARVTSVRRRWMPRLGHCPGAFRQSARLVTRSGLAGGERSPRSARCALGSPRCVARVDARLRFCCCTCAGRESRTDREPWPATCRPSPPTLPGRCAEDDQRPVRDENPQPPSHRRVRDIDARAES